MEEDDKGLRLSKRFSDKGGEVDYKTTSGTAWSHNFLNQKPWHPLSYPNQRRKWIAEQQHAQHERRAEEVAREYAQEQDFFRQAALVSKREKEKLEMLQAVSFMYVRPPGYNAESAKAADLAGDKGNDHQKNASEGPSSTSPQETAPVKEEKKKPRPKDIYGRPLPTEDEFAVLKNAPRMDTGIQARAKPFAVEVRNVKCVRCGNFGHQSGDRECPLKDAIMPNEESRLKRDDPLTAIIAHTDVNEPLKWELKQRPGLSPPRGGFNPDDPNQQIVAEEIYDEYGGFLGGGDIPDLLTSLPFLKHKKKSKRKKHKKQSSSSSSSGDDVGDGKSRGKEKKHKRRKANTLSSSGQSEDSDSERHGEKSRRRNLSSDGQQLDHHPRHSRHKDDHRKMKNPYASEYGLSDRWRADRSPLRFDNRERSSRGKEKKGNYSFDEVSDHEHKERSSSRQQRNVRQHMDRSPSPYTGSERHLRRKQGKNSHSSDEEDSDHRHHKSSTSKKGNVNRRMDRSSPPCDDRRGSRKGKGHDHGKKLKDDDDEDSSENSEPDRREKRKKVKDDDRSRSRKDKSQEKGKRLKDDGKYEADPFGRQSDSDGYHRHRSRHSHRRG